MTNGQKIALIGCSGDKLAVAAPARELYQGQLFRMARTWAETHCVAWGVLSAKHGLVLPDTVIEPYNERLPHNRDRLKLWARRVHWRVKDRWFTAGYVYDGPLDRYGGRPVLWDPEHPDLPELWLLCGQEYRSPFIGDLAEDCDLEVLPCMSPFEEMRGIGEMLSWLKRENEAAGQLTLPGVSK